MIVDHRGGRDMDGLQEVQPFPGNASEPQDEIPGGEGPTTLSHSG